MAWKLFCVRIHLYVETYPHIRRVVHHDPYCIAVIVLVGQTGPVGLLSIGAGIRMEKHVPRPGISLPTSGAVVSQVFCDRVERVVNEHLLRDALLLKDPESYPLTLCLCGLQGMRPQVHIRQCQLVALYDTLLLHPMAVVVERLHLIRVPMGVRRRAVHSRQQRQQSLARRSLRPSWCRDHVTTVIMHLGKFVGGGRRRS